MEFEEDSTEDIGDIDSIMYQSSGFEEIDKTFEERKKAVLNK